MYKIVKTFQGECIVKDNCMFIPKDIRNSDYRDYLEWVDLGNEAEVEDYTGEENE